jgi:hypothetical protein
MSKPPKSKKAKAAPPPPASVPIEARIAHEREWAHERWLERHSFAQIRQLANLPVDEGGLGHDLSVQAVKGLVLQAREARGDMHMSRDERLERQAAEIDELARGARNALAKAASGEVVTKVKVKVAKDVEGMVDVVLAPYVDHDAAKLLLAAHKREADLFGLDAPTAATLEVTHRDALADELNVMLERAGRPPIEVAS